MSGIWFKTSHIGENRLKTFMKEICSITGVDLQNRRITNHSGRKTLIQSLQKKDKERADIIKVTRHSSIEGLKPYELPKENTQTTLLMDLIDSIQVPSKQNKQEGYFCFINTVLLINLIKLTNCILLDFIIPRTSNSQHAENTSSNEGEFLIFWLFS